MKKSKSVREMLRSMSEADLLSKLRGPQPELQGPICAELGRRRSEKAVQSLKARLASSDEHVREAAAEALGKIGDPTVGSDLQKIFADPRQPEFVRDTSAFALGRLRYEPAVPALVSALTENSRTVKLCAVAALAAIGSPEVCNRVERLSQTEKDEDIREAMQKLVKSLGHPEQPPSDTVRRPRSSRASRIPQTAR